MLNSHHGDESGAGAKRLAQNPPEDIEPISTSDIQLEPRRPKRPRRKRRATRRAAAQTALAGSAASLKRHKRKCHVCQHPDREEIEEDFVHWHDPHFTALDYGIPVRSIWRHAHATGIDSVRQGNLRSVLDRVLERTGRMKVTGDCIIRAVRAYTCLGDDNRWTEPTSRVAFSAERLDAGLQTASRSVSADEPIDVFPPSQNDQEASQEVDGF